MATDNIEGTATDAQGNPLQDAVIALFLTNKQATDGDQFTVQYTRTNTNGFYSIDDHPDGDGTSQEWHVAGYYEDGTGEFNALSKPSVSASVGPAIPDFVVTRYNYEDPSTPDKAVDTVGDTDATISTNASDPFSTDSAVGTYALDHDKSSNDSSTSDSTIDLIGLGEDDTFGIAAWVKPDQINSFDSPFEWMSGSDDGPTVFMSNDSTPKWEVNLREGGGNNNAKTGIDIATGQYYHIVVGVTYADVEIWVNSPASASPNATTTHGISDLSSTFAQYNLRTSSGDRNLPFDGLVDDFIGLKKAPTAAEVDSLYNL